eukprot:Gregarina_sp_Poly_1__6287@NODE_333_length_9463_cov_335_720094_g281_i0_p14_GENE_NODE_333_length_9463_cov_335_720094_g281_i0NODE_333_length_9463_cov_335_720094_g281_i0_p14_ORF_typecomplete_len101_score14_16_NODE_333_length_9463_cov_335_720094_g281_i041264428
MEGGVGSPINANYDLRVASYYPHKCDHLIPFTGVPTEELARRSLVHEKAGGKGRVATQGSHNVRQCMDDNRNAEGSSKLQWFGSKTLPALYQFALQSNCH